MATTSEDEGINVCDGSGDAKQDYLRVAYVLEDMLRDVTAGTGDGASALIEILEIAAQEFGVERDDQGKSMNRRKKSTETSMGSERVKRRCGHSCSDHIEPMNPKLWGALPRELLERVFAHLPVDEISRLQLLSKDWQQITSSADFHRVCSEVYPKMVCLVTKDMYNLFWVRVLDHLQKWHTYKIRVTVPLDDLGWSKVPCPKMKAECEDQGLVCFVTSWNLDSKKKKLRPSYFFNVVNPLTRISRELPPLFDLRDMELVRIHVDRKTKAFKVVAFASRLVWTKVDRWTCRGSATHVYDSLTEEWMTTYASDIVPKYRKVLAYNFANGQLFNMDDDANLRTNIYRIGSAFYKERLFELQLGSDGPANDETANQSPMYYIEEFHWDSVWVKVKTHRCDPFENPSKVDYSMRLHACYGFLMVIAEFSSHSANKRFGNQLAWLYDLSTRKWSVLDLPQLPVGRRTYDPHDHDMCTVELPGGRKLRTNMNGTYDVCLMCEPQWARTGR